MKLPHKLRFHSHLPRWFGQIAVGRPFSALTLGWITFVPDGRIPMHQVWVHEGVHAKDFWVGWAAGLALWALLTPPWWWLLATPLTYSVAYLAGMVWAWLCGGHPYRDCWAEVRARREAGEP